MTPGTLCLETALAGKRMVPIPERGLILVTGPNGCGKSTTYVDGLAWALWGKSPRLDRTLNCPEGRFTYIDDAEDLRIERRRTSRGVQLAVNGVAYENTTKGQDALTAMVGPLARWHRISVLSVLNASFFTLAADKARKALVEEMIPNFSNFDGGYKSCRADQSVAAAQIATLDRQVLEKTTRLQGVIERLADAQQTTLAPDLPALEKAVEACTATVESARAARRVAIVGVEKAVRLEQGNAHAQFVLDKQRYELADTALKNLRATPVLENCMMCRRPFDHLSVKACHDKIAQDCAAAEKEVYRLREVCQRSRQLKAEADAQAVQAERVYADADKVERVATRHLEAVQAQLREGLAAAQRWEVQEKRLATLRQEQADIEAALAVLRTQLGEVQREALILERCGDVLGPKGLRAHLIEQTLLMLQHGINHHLSCLWPGAAVALPAPCDGKDTIEMTLSGFGAATDPIELSNGQRRILDLAVFWARGDLLRSAWGQPPGYEVYDEIFDGIHPDVIPPLLVAMQRRAQTRPVFVITQREQEISGLPWDEHRRMT